MEVSDYVFCEGSMQKKEAKGKWVTYYCVLRGDRLWCFNNRDTNNQHSLVGSIKMTSTTQLKKHKTKDGNYQFKIRNDRGEYRFRCAFANDRDQWLGEIGKCARGEIPFPGSVVQANPPVPNPTSSSMPVSSGLLSGSNGGGGLTGGSPIPDVRQPMAPPPMPQPYRFNRPPMEVPMDSISMGSVHSLHSISSNDFLSQQVDNLLPGQRIALQESMRKPPAPAGVMPSFVSQQQQKLVRGHGASASMRSVYHPDLTHSKSTPSSDEFLDQEWFYGKIPRERAEDYILNFGQVGSFLLRESESAPGCYSLSFRSEQNDVRHYKITAHGRFLTLTGLEERSFPNLLEVVQYYVQVNEGWAIPLRRSETGYRKHPGLRDDAQLNRTSAAMMDPEISALINQSAPPVPTWSGPGSHSGGRAVPPPPMGPPPDDVDDLPPPPTQLEYPAFEEGFDSMQMNGAGGAYPPPPSAIMDYPPPPPPNF